MPALLWPSPKGDASPGQYIERSETIGTSDVTTVDIEPFSRRGSPSPAGLIVIRSFPGTVFGRVITSPLSSRNRSCTVAGVLKTDCSTG